MLGNLPFLNYIFSKIVLCCPCVTPDILLYITDLATCIMQDFLNNFKKKMAPIRHFGFQFCKICHGLSLCDALHFVIYPWSSFFASFLSHVKYHKITQIQNSKHSKDT